MGKLVLYIILFVGLVLRLLFIDKPDGLWNDEYVSWMVSQVPLGKEFVQQVFKQCHMPFYYLYLKFYTGIFGDSDLALRLSSLIPAIPAIYVMYLVGKVKSKDLGLLCAGYSAVSAFLIYYSQEVRFYSLLFLFSALSFLFTLKLISKVSIKNLAGYIISNALILFTHTIGFVFVFFNLLFVSAKLFKKYRKQIIVMWSSIFVLGCALSPLIIKILTDKTFSQWWNTFTPSKIMFVFSDYFTPTLTNLTSSPNNFFYNLNFSFFIFCIVPLIISVYLLARAIQKRENLQIFSMVILTLIVLVIASISGKLVLLTKYSIEIYPILIYLLCCGLLLLNKKWVRNTFIIGYCLLSLAYLIVSPISAPRIRRAEGHKLVADMLQRGNPQKGDIILLEYYAKNRFVKYFDFSGYKVIKIDKGNFYAYMDDDAGYAHVYANGKEAYRNIFKSGYNKHLINKMNNEIINQLQPGQSLFIVVLDSVSSYTDEVITQVAKDDEVYQKVPLLFLVFSHVKNQTIKNAMEQLPITYFERKGKWSLIKFTKLKM